VSRTRYHFCYCLMLCGIALGLVTGYYLPRDRFSLAAWVAAALALAGWHFARSVREGVRTGDTL